MRRLLGGLAALCTAATAGASAMPRVPVSKGLAPTPIEYFCSPGYAPRRGRCVATAARDEIEIFAVDPGRAPARLRRQRRRALD